MGKFVGPWLAGLLPSGLRGLATHTPRLLIRTVGLKNRSAGSSPALQQGLGEKKRGRGGCSCHPFSSSWCPQGWGQAARLRWAHQCHLQRGFLCVPKEGTGGNAGEGCTFCAPPCASPPSARLHRSWLRHLFSPRRHRSSAACAALMGRGERVAGSGEGGGVPWEGASPGRLGRRLRHSVHGSGRAYQESSRWADARSFLSS